MGQRDVFILSVLTKKLIAREIPTVKLHATEE